LDRKQNHSPKNKNIMKKSSTCLIAAISFLFSSCTKEDFEIDLSGLGGGGGGWGIPSIYGITFDNNAISHIKLPQWRYFIYKDPGTSSTDSVVVTESNIVSVIQPAVMGNPVIPGFIYDKYVLTLSSIVATGNQTWYSGIAFCDSQHKNVPLFIDSNFNLSNGQTNLPAFWYPFTSSGSLQYSKISSTVIEGVTYNNVHRFSASNGLPPTDPNYLATAFWWADGIGIIKREITTAGSVKTQHLLRYG